MTFWILAALLIYVLQTFLPPLFRYVIRRDSQVMALLGPRDDPPETSRYGARSERALQNASEAIVVFIPLALLAHEVEEAFFGAQLFVVARVLYVPAYLLGIPVVRSLIWLVAFAGLVIMAAAVAA